MRMVILDGYTINPGDNPWSELEKIGELSVYDRTPQSKIIERCVDAEIIFTSKNILTEQIINSLPNLKFISVLATGYNTIDISAATKNKIIVSNVPGYSPPSVAQHVFALLLNFSNQVSLHDKAVKNGEWSSQEDFCFWKAPLFELQGKKLGVVGFGDIGSKVAALANAFGMEVIAYSPRPKQKPDYLPFKFSGLEELMRESDVISLHCPLTVENEKFINRSILQSMKKNAILINTARGQLINEVDLAEALKTGTIGGAALDVVNKEPMQPNNPLLDAPNIIITPHIAWATLEARTRLTKSTVNNLESFIKGTPVNVVNNF
ncbi:D-2-hydroxyacid dehydrogenase [Maridesulfovibrio ferrireducens]|uniref:D-2-hydroxyacid dehydrogenase n=1 Tax=Maridesulfovibrio ferrireducens TaxID=246191 RepID=UPI001A2E6799|nr:D-2-hydroxyacid dehydrogenase [Maridesulfovibrio ferrireducens]MBI9111498.1 D-2-hydroxyacid dehydrogenase [Maridesulfovibrio ferrireducens]